MKILFALILSSLTCLAAATYPVVTDNPQRTFSGGGTNMAGLTNSQTFTGQNTFNALITLGSGSGTIQGGLADAVLTTSAGAVVSYGSGGTRGSLGLFPRLAYTYGADEKFGVLVNGTVMLGKTSEASTVTLSSLATTNVLKIGSYGLSDGAAVEFLQMATPAAPTANSARLYSKDDAGTARIYGMAEDGTEFLLTPHSKLSPGRAVDGNDPDPVVFHESNAFLGRERFIHVTAAIREIEKLTGKKFIFDRKIKKEDWKSHQERAKKAHEDARASELSALRDWESDKSETKPPRPHVRKEFKPKPFPFNEASK